MPVVNRVAALTEEISAWRRDLHQHPELQYDLPRTAACVRDRLTSFGVDDVVPGIGRTGVVGVIHGRRRDSGRVVALRADMDALPIEELTGLPYASITPGKMHACGHDGHTAMLLGAAKYLAETRNFNGTAVVIFQPAEEGGAGAKAMIDDGLLERFGIQEVYGMHNMPGLPLGSFATRPGPLMASADRVFIDIEGKGGHAAHPQATVDTVLVGAAIVQTLQSVVSRNLDPLESGVVSITMFQAGYTDNVIPQTAHLRGTSRALTHEVRDLLETRIRHIVEATATIYGATARTDYRRDYPVLRNHPRETEYAVAVAREVAGPDQVAANFTPVMWGEDFAFMLERRPGALIFAGNGEHSAGLHHPAYDFNDQLIPAGASYWVRLVETRMPA
ncbi:M20 aminoacylase family protein [Blastochloris viridis]|uniref:N-acetyl-L,L-diaminopimelate deacetylase n=1 Tax=Blastochloris viridis TaxID=1079 RepID=A0A0H5BPX3_BLAVI|nr:M20 aminoacylase family protein [Blastochloris viridis]ALK10064.1 putative hydrolase YxeP [Blastochloris viridis]BAS00014.1 N-acetyl-L,L-diaminopimelate deacetylase [Blastochloris viridis]CUU42728.1 putative hydrolase YxeP [Blastochloris viridis]